MGMLKEMHGGRNNGLTPVREATERGDLGLEGGPWVSKIPRKGGEAYNLEKE